MTGIENLLSEINKYNCICFYPSSGTDLSDIDFFGSGKKLRGERLEDKAGKIVSAEAADDSGPDLFIHTDLNFYSDYESGFDASPKEYNINGEFEVLGFRELSVLEEPNLIHDNFVFSGKCFEYKFRVWGREKILTLIVCLIENEALIARIFLANKLKLDFIWSKNWNGGKTRGTWMANVLDLLETRKIYTDWLCVPGQRGEPGNKFVEDKYPMLMKKPGTRLIRNNDNHWIEEGQHGWVEEFLVQSIG